ncbi:TlpA family protein disulfide reductase [Synergistaceae bacterium OttesenSCG-928-D05]|nr:TlpA family protein disulfide reductase [Synergistaceae bacterium OttesenSCG-928-D05]
MKRKVTVFCVLIIALVLFTATAATALEIGAQVPNFTLSDMDGKKVSLEDFRGKPVLLNFWASWCPPCRAEMPDFNELNAELEKSKEAVLLAINLTDGRRETKNKAEKYLASNNLKLNVLLDEKGTAAEIFDIRGIPTTIVIDAKGVMRGQIVGATDKETVKAMLAELK